MAIYGAGSNWDGREVSGDFFQEGRFVIGWDQEHGNDLQSLLSALRVGDIIYLKSNRPGSRDIRVKGIGTVTKAFFECIQDGEYPQGNVSDWQSFFIGVRWIVQDEFLISIPEDVGRLTNIRAATFYEEPLPIVQRQIIERLFAGTEN